MKKLISLALIFSLLSYLTGCYSMREVTKEEFISQEEYDKASLITKDNKEYQFNDMQYIINSDTLIGTGMRLSGNNETQFAGKIALDDVTTFNLDKFNVGVAILASVLIIGLVGIASNSTPSRGEGWDF
jgi:hypothetical protein